MDIIKLLISDKLIVGGVRPKKFKLLANSVEVTLPSVVPNSLNLGGTISECFL